VPPSRLREKNPPRQPWDAARTPRTAHKTRKEPEMTESSEWQRIGEVPVDTGRLVVFDPVNLDDVGDVVEHEMDSMTYGFVTNEIGVAVAMVLSTGLGDGVYPVEARFEEAAGAVRIAEIRVRFLSHPVIGYELPR
jgi:hypothetical protein